MADGCVVFAPTTKTLVAHDGATWSLGTAGVTSNFHLLRNGVDTGGQAAEILLANSGHVYVKAGPGDNGGGQNTWFLWNGSAFTAFQFPPITITAASNTLNVAPNSGLTPLGLAAPSDNLYANASLTVVVDLVPANGAVFLSDRTVVSAGQTLTLAQLAELKFQPTTNVTSWSSSFAYHVSDPATVTALGDVGLNITAGTGLWSDPPGAATAGAGVLAFPTVTQPSLGGDVIGLRVQNPLGSTEAAGYVTHGHLFLQGAVQRTDTIVARRIGGSTVYVQMDIRTSHADGSVRWAMMTYPVPRLARTATQDVMFAKCTSGCPTAPSPVAPTAASIANGSWEANPAYDVNSTITFTSGATGTAAVSCKSILSAAVAAGQVMTLLNGPAVKEYAAMTTAGQGKLKVECDIRAYADGTTSTEVILDTGWFFSSGKSDLVYNISFTQDGFTASGVKQWLYTNWAHKINSAGLITPNIQYDVPYMMATGAMPFIDPSYGVLYSKVASDFAQISTVPMNPALFTLNMSIAGGRQDLAPIPAWMSRWLMSQDSRAYAVMLFMADAGGTFPIRYIDERVNAPFGELVNVQTYPNIGFATRPVNGGDQGGGSQCGGNTACPNGDPWELDTAHQPDASYFACLTTGLRFYCQNFKAQADWSIYNVQGYGSSVDYVQGVGTGYMTSYINIPPSSRYFGSPGNNSSNSLQVRAMAWDTRQIGEAAYLLPDSDPLKEMFVSELTKGLKGAAQLYILDDQNSVYGQLTGFLTGYFGSDESDFAIHTHYVPPWENNFLAIELGLVANMGITNASPVARRILDHQSNFLTGLYLNGANGYDPLDGAPYKIVNLGGLNTEAKPAITTWAQLFNNSYVGPPQSWPGPGALGLPSRSQIIAVFRQLEVVTFGSAAYPNGQGGAVGGYPQIARAGEAIRISQLGYPSNYHAYGFLIPWINQAYNQCCSGSDIVTDNRYSPGFNIVPRLPTGSWMFSNRSFVDTSGRSTINLRATPGPSVIGVVGPGTATLTGEDIGPIDTFQCDAGPCTVNAGKANSYVTGACGAMTYIDNTGTNDILINDCGTGVGGNGNGNAANLKFHTVGSGTTTVRGFRSGKDKWTVKSNLNANGLTTATQVATRCSVGAGATTCHLGSGNKAVVFIDATPAASDIVIE